MSDARRLTNLQKIGARHAQRAGDLERALAAKDAEIERLGALLDRAVAEGSALDREDVPCAAQRDRTTIEDLYRDPKRWSRRWREAMEGRKPLHAEIERLGGALKRIAKDGCGCYGSPSGETCRSEHPGDESEWCWCCIAAEAIAHRANSGGE